MQDTPKGSRIQKGSKIHQKKEARHISLNMHQILVEIGGNTKKSTLEEHT